MIPVTLLIFQITGVVNHAVSYIDEFDFWYSLPLVIPVIILLYLLSKKLNAYANALDVKKEIENELEKLS